MLRKIWWWVAGVTLSLGLSGGTLALLYTTISHMASPLMGPICPGLPLCG